MAHRDLWIDFNGVDNDFHASSLTEYASEGVEVAVGARLVVGDDQGNLCQATVVGVDKGGVVELVVDGNTFERGHDHVHSSLIHT